MTEEDLDFLEYCAEMKEKENEDFISFLINSYSSDNEKEFNEKDC